MEETYFRTFPKDLREQLILYGGYWPTYIDQLPPELREELQYRMCDITWNGKELVFGDRYVILVYPVGHPQDQTAIRDFIRLIENRRVAFWKPNPYNSITYKPRSKTLVIRTDVQRIRGEEIHPGMQAIEIPYCPLLLAVLRRILGE